MKILSAVVYFDIVYGFEDGGIALAWITNYIKHKVSMVLHTHRLDISCYLHYLCQSRIWHFCTVTSSNASLLQDKIVTSWNSLSSLEDNKFMHVFLKN